MRVIRAVLVALLVITVSLMLLKIGMFFAGKKGFPGNRIDKGGTLHGGKVKYTRSRSHRTRGGPHFSVSRLRGTLGSDVGWVVGGGALVGL